MKLIWSDIQIWATFLWAAIFSFIAIVLRVLREMAHKKKAERRDVNKALIDVATVTFFGGLFGWLMALVFPNVTQESPTVVAIGAALMAYSGLTASQALLYRLFHVVTGVEVPREDVEGDGRRQEKED